MNLKNTIKKLFTKNTFVKPLAVITSSTPSLTYLTLQSQHLFSITALPENPNYVAISIEAVKSFQGSLMLLVLLISIINIYHPSKIIIGTLILGGMALVASCLLQTIGLTFLTYGVGLLFNNLTLDRTILRNNKLLDKKLDNAVDNLIKEAQR